MRHRFGPASRGSSSYHFKVTKVSHAGARFTRCCLRPSPQSWLARWTSADASGEQGHAPGGEDDPGEPAHEPATRQDLFEQHEDREYRDPREIHDSQHEEEGHQEPAATEAIQAVVQTHHEGTPSPVVPMGGEEDQRRPTMAQAGVLERRPLKDAGEQQHNPADHRCRAPHHRGQQIGDVQAPVRQCRHGREADPDEQVAEDEQPRGYERPPVALTLPHHSRKQQHHRCCRRQHHRHHHHGPHDEHEDDVVQAPGLGAGHGHAGGHGIDAHRVHAGGKSHRVGPSERGEDGDRRDQHSSVTPDELAVGQVGSHRKTTKALGVHGPGDLPDGAGLALVGQWHVGVVPLGALAGRKLGGLVCELEG